MILGFAHPSLVVPNLEDARQFYEKMFGFTVCGTEGWSDNPDIDEGLGLKNSSSKGYMLRGHNCYPELFQYLTPEATGLEPVNQGPNELGIRHIAFYVDDCHKELKRFVALGGQAIGNPVGSDDSGWAVYCRDPFGNIVELAEVMSQEESPVTLPGVSCLGTFEGNSQ
jgi:catechol 2,3-dioxygenase-like lactoylglutathione lyase family enzyme